MYLTDNKKHLIKINAKALRAVIGQKVRYLRDVDIDKSYRGYFFPRIGKIKSVVGKNIELESGDWLYSADLKEIVLEEHYKPQS